MMLEFPQEIQILGFSKYFGMENLISDSKLEVQVMKFRLGDEKAEIRNIPLELGNDYLFYAEDGALRMASFDKFGIFTVCQLG